jgi:hypothetical protein
VTATNNLLKTNITEKVKNLFPLVNNPYKCGNVQVLSTAVTNETQDHEEIKYRLYSRNTILPPYPLFQSSAVYHSPNKKWKIIEINGS